MGSFGGGCDGRMNVPSHAAFAARSPTVREGRRARVGATEDLSAQAKPRAPARIKHRCRRLSGLEAMPWRQASARQGVQPLHAVWPVARQLAGLQVGRGKGPALIAHPELLFVAPVLWACGWCAGGVPQMGALAKPCPRRQKPASRMCLRGRARGQAAAEPGERRWRTATPALPGGRARISGSSVGAQWEIRGGGCRRSGQRAREPGLERPARLRAGGRQKLSSTAPWLALAALKANLACTPRV